MTRILRAALGLCMLASAGLTQDTGEPRRRADRLASDEKWAEAAEAYAALTASDPTDISSWTGLGRARRSLDQLDLAVAAYEQALALDGESFTALVGMAITYERLERLDRAFGYLEKIAGMGITPLTLKDNPAFAGLREHERFAVSVGIAERAANPCRQGGPYDDFDFWIGDWDVYVNERKGPRNVITKEMNGCIVRERYKNAGYEGESINYVDPESGRWKQNWVDSSGGIVRYAGGLAEDGVMKMEGANTGPDGKTQLARVTWTRLEDGRVHHVIEQSKDDGESWQPYFDGTYVARDAEPAEKR